MRVSVLTEFTDDLGVVELIVAEEVFGVLIDVDLDFGERVVDGGDLVSFSNSGIEPGFKDSDFISFVEFFNEGFYGAVTSDVIENLFNIDFIAFKIDERSEDLGGGVGVDLEEVDFNEFVEIVFVKIFGEFFDVVMNIAEEDKRLRIREFEVEEKSLDLDGVITVWFFFNNSLYFSQLIALSSGLDKLKVNFLIFSGVDNGSQEQENSVESSD